MSEQRDKKKHLSADLETVQCELDREWRRANAAEASLDALRAQVRPVVEDMRTLAMVAGQASVEEYDLVRAGADAKFAAFATVWADRLAALLDPPSGAPQKNDDDELARVDGQP